ncbi:MAG TPA: bifunctional precorrin-2 dehydrogenase/sirohydrochlorin ferrochelatase [Dehalococcoidia bacterium]|nr:bifunctional precorrin-2 dehydrogenase/sirohydrochlorin ferrochelatase [Dehalococcoidia bacterium]
MEYYPIFVDLKARPVLVVGGGKVAEGKVQGLLAAGAGVTVVAPQLTATLGELVAGERIRWLSREYEPADLNGRVMCFVATDDGAINAKVASDCRDRGVWVNAADDPANCDFILPAVVRSGKTVVAASTGGASPAMARRLRQELTAFLDEDYAPLTELLAEVRGEVRAAGLTVDGEAWQDAIDATLRTLVAQGRIDEARVRLRAALGVDRSPARREG